MIILSLTVNLPNITKTLFNNCLSVIEDQLLDLLICVTHVSSEIENVSLFVSFLPIFSLF